MLIKRVEPNCVIPRGYGLVYFDWLCNRAVCMPVVLNVIARWARLAWLWVKFGRICNRFGNQLEAYRAGIAHGVEKERQSKFCDAEHRMRRSHP